jgi:hypothetical protein
LSSEAGSSEAGSSGSARSCIEGPATGGGGTVIAGSGMISPNTTLFPACQVLPTATVAAMATTDTAIAAAVSFGKPARDFAAEPATEAAPDAPAERSPGATAENETPATSGNSTARIVPWTSSRSARTAVHLAQASRWAWTFSVELRLSALRTNAPS